MVEMQLPGPAFLPCPGECPHWCLREWRSDLDCCSVPWAGEDGASAVREDAPAALPVRSSLPGANQLQLHKDSPHHPRDELYQSMKDTHGDHHEGPWLPRSNSMSEEPFILTMLAVIIF